MNKPIFYLSLISTLMLSGCQTVTTLSQAVASASPPATPAQIILVCRDASCQNGNPPTSAPVNGGGYYEVLPQRPAIYLQALHTELLNFSVLANNTPLPHITGGSVDQCQPNGCVMLNSQIYVDANKNPILDANGNKQTMEHVFLVLPLTFLANQESVTVVLQTQSLNTQYANTPQQTATTNLMLGSVPPSQPSINVRPNQTATGYSMTYYVSNNPFGAVIDGYKLYAHDTNGQPFATVNIPPVDIRNDQFNWTDSSFNYSGLSQTFYVTTFNNSGTSSFSEPISVTVPQKQPAGRSGNSIMKTCSGAAATMSYQTFVVPAESSNMCVQNVSEGANTLAEAEACVTSQSPGAKVGSTSTAYLVVYTPDGDGGYMCQTTQQSQINSGDAQQCVTGQYQGDPGAVVKDITSAIVSNGAVNSTLLGDYCTQNPSP